MPSGAPPCPVAPARFSPMSMLCSRVAATRHSPSSRASVMSSNLVFFAVHADDLPRAQRFYQNVFGWKFQPWGPPGFFLVATGDKKDPGIPGALQQRHDLIPGQRVNCFECTIGVDDIDAAAKAIVANGGKIILEKCE